MTRSWKDIVLAVTVSVILTGCTAWFSFGNNTVTKAELAAEIEEIKQPVATLTIAVNDLRVEITKLSTIIDERTGR